MLWVHKTYYCPNLHESCRKRCSIFFFLCCLFKPDCKSKMQFTDMHFYFSVIYADASEALQQVISASVLVQHHVQPQRRMNEWIETGTCLLAFFFFFTFKDIEAKKKQKKSGMISKMTLFFKLILWFQCVKYNILKKKKTLQMLHSYFQSKNKSQFCCKCRNCCDTLPIWPAEGSKALNIFSAVY